MARYVDFHTQLASIMEVLANAAVAEICQLVDEEFANLRLEISRSQRENLALKSRLRLVEVRSGGGRVPGEPVISRSHLDVLICFHLMQPFIFQRLFLQIDPPKK